MVFPAYAGVSPSVVSHRRHHDGLPRLRGGEPSPRTAFCSRAESSPPTRG